MAEPMLNPGTGISNFAGEEKAEPRIIKMPAKKSISRRIIAPTILPTKISVARKSRPMADKLKVLRLQNMLDRKRLQNQIEKFKLAKRIDMLKKKGKLQQIMTTPIMKPALGYPAFATQEVMNDLDSVYQDIGHGEASLWGNESFYDENYYNEDYYGNEFDNDPMVHLAIKIKSGVSPLLW